MALNEAEKLSILVPRQGSLAIDTGRRSHLLKPGSLLLLPPNSRVTRTIPDATGLFWSDLILYPMRLLQARNGTTGQRIDLERLILPESTHEHDQALRYLANYLLTLDSRLDASPERDRACDAASFMLEDLLVTVCNEAAGNRLADIAERGAADRKLAQRAAGYLEAHVDQPFSSRKLALQLGVSERRVQLAFQRIHGQSPRGFLIERRLDKAHALLCNPTIGMSVTDIALACGFGNHGRFAAAYARRFGLSPSQARRRSR